MTDHIVSALLSVFLVLWTSNSIHNRYFYSIMYNSYSFQTVTKASPDFALTESPDMIKDYMFQRLVVSAPPAEFVNWCLC